MDSKLKILPFAILFIPTIAFAQFSGYLSSSYGYNANPLYNYAQAPDQLSQSYIELHHESDFDNSSLDLVYTGGLMVFNQFNERSYYEHSLAGRWGLTTEEPEDERPEVDSTGAYLASELRFTARHDKNTFEVYDNTSGALNVSYRTMTNGSLFMRISNKAEYRSYKLVDELSNFTDILTLSLGSHVHDRVYFETFLSAGVKHYTTTLNDTSTYETIESTGSGTGTVTGTGHGNGKGNGNSGGSSGSAPGFVKKQHLYVTPESNTSWQYVAGAILGKQWATSTATLAFLYRYNPTTTVRYVAQYVSTSTLSEDIYNDHFAYEGAEAGFTFSQSLPKRITAALHFQWAGRTYGAPALSLDGVQVATQRKDNHAALELTLSKGFTIAEGVELEVNLTGNATRNSSNDEYNDYSGSAVAVGVAVGF